jgi:hypothetical protein
LKGWRFGDLENWRFFGKGWIFRGLGNFDFFLGDEGFYWLEGVYWALSFKY